MNTSDMNKSTYQEETQSCSDEIELLREMFSDEVWHKGIQSA